MHDAHGGKAGARKKKQEGRVDSPQRGRGEAHGAPDIHGVPQDIEGETLNPMVHEDTKVVPEERTGYTESPSGG